MALKIIWNDILREEADAVVTPASRNARIGIGLDRVIHRAAGPKLLAERRKMGRIGPGKVGVSPAFGVGRRTGAKWIIHALGPVWTRNAGQKEELILDGCYLRILCKAAELGCGTVSLPLLSSGKFGMPIDRCLRVAVTAIRDFLAAFPSLEVKLVLVDGDFFQWAVKTYPRLCVSRFTDAQEKAYRDGTGIERADDPNDLDDAFEIGEEEDLYDDLLLDRLAGDGTFKDMFRNLWAYVQRRDRAAQCAMRKGGDEPLPDEFLVSRKVLSHRSSISETTIKHLCSSGAESTRTSKDKVVALCFALRLPLAYAQRLLASCGYELGRTKRDRIVRQCLEDRVKNLSTVRGMLTAAGEADLALDRIVESC